LVQRGDNGELVEKYASAGSIVTSNERTDLRHAVEMAYEARSEARVAIHPEFAEKFSRRELARQLAALFDKATAQPRSRSGRT